MCKVGDIYPIYESKDNGYFNSMPLIRPEHKSNKFVENMKKMNFRIVGFMTIKSTKPRPAKNP